MRLQTKLMAAIGIIFILSFAVVEFFDYRQIRHDVQRDMYAEAKVLHDLIMSTRSVYQKQFLESGLELDENTLGFLPGHALPRIVRQFEQWDKSGLTFNNVSDRPRNPVNKADGIEEEAIRFFKENPRAEEWMETYRSEEGQRFFQYSTPLWIDSYCLNCHSREGEASPTLKDYYATDLDYEMEDLAGILSIKLPASILEQRVARQMKQNFFTHLGLFAITFLAVSFFLRRFVLRPLEHLKSATTAWEGGDYSVRAAVAGKDEMADISQAFDNMARAVADREESVLRERGFLQNVIDGIADPIMVIDTDFRILLMNNAVGRDSTDLMAEEERLCHRLSHHSDTPCFGEDHPCPLREVVRTGRSVTVVHRHYYQGEERIVELVASPLWRADGSLLGIIESSRDITARVEAEATVRESERRLKHLAHHDPLTGLPNRLLFKDRLEHALYRARRSGRSLALMFLDLDCFKHFNDSLGHEAGDRILREVAGRLSASVREADTVARIGGDEFVIILEDMHNSEEARAVAEKIQKGLLPPVILGTREGESGLHITTSIGIAVYPTDGQTAETLMINADTAMYRAKDCGRDTFKFYS